MDNMQLCLALMRADSEAEVIALLVEAGYWDDPSSWRFVGDSDNNFSSIGNQQSEPIAALIEKIVNSIDARLTNACLLAGLDPTSAAAPTSIRQAVARFFEGKDSPHPDVDGRIGRWNSDKTTEEGRLLTLSATGFPPSEGQPCLSIADQGEGQEPDAFPDTFMSLLRSNKLRVHFVQGKFNMGGTGALQFCGGKHKFQLIVSRRNPAFVTAGSSARASEWGFTIVRREPPQDGGRSSVFTYLAPVGDTSERRGGVLSFAAETLPIFPEADASVRDAYHRHSPHGSLVKLYEYEWQGVKSNIVMSGGGLLRRVDSGLPELGLPVRVYECRPNYAGHGASFATNVLGIAARLEKNKGDTLEAGFPVGGLLHVGGSDVRVRIYAFGNGADARAYRTAKQGVVFTVNGQSHATMGTEFFRRKQVGMSYLADSLFVLVDCSGVEEQGREELFMNSRDRLRDTPVSRQLETELESLIRTDDALRHLRNTRRSAELTDRLEDSKPLANILHDLLKKSPSLSRLFLLGMKVPSPFPPGGAGPGTATDFQGKPFPTYFRFRGMETGETLERDAHLESKARITFETDAEDDYFGRELSRGACRVLLDVGDDSWEEVIDWQMRGPRSGLAHLSIDLPEGASAGEKYSYRIEIVDEGQFEPFINLATLRVLPPAAPSSGTSGTARSKNTGSGVGAGGGGSTLALPNITEVEEADWPVYGFTDATALRVVHAGDDDTEANVYDFYVNVDNKFLRTAQKERAADPKLLRAQFKYALVLVGLSLLQDEKHVTTADDDDSGGTAGGSIETVIERTSSALAPVLLPMIEALSQLAVDEDDD